MCIKYNFYAFHCEIGNEVFEMYCSNGLHEELIELWFLFRNVATSNLYRKHVDFENFLNSTKIMSFVYQIVSLTVRSI